MYEPGHFNLACGECSAGHVWDAIDGQVRALAAQTAEHEQGLVDGYIQSSARVAASAETVEDVLAGGDVLGEMAEMTATVSSAVGNLSLGLEQARDELRAQPCVGRPGCARLMLFAQRFDVLATQLRADITQATGEE